MAKSSLPKGRTVSTHGVRTRTGTTPGGRRYHSMRLTSDHKDTSVHSDKEGVSWRKETRPGGTAKTKATVGRFSQVVKNGPTKPTKKAKKAK